MSATRQVPRIVLAIVWLAAVPRPAPAQSATGSIDGVVLSVVTFDPRVAREIPIGGGIRAQLIWEAFNLLNRDNINDVDTTYYSVAGTTLTRSQNFGRPLSSAGERIMQLAVKVLF